MTHICVSILGHHRSRKWLGDKLKYNLNKNKTLFIQQNEFKISFMKNGDHILSAYMCYRIHLTPYQYEINITYGTFQRMVLTGNILFV